LVGAALAASLARGRKRRQVLAVVKVKWWMNSVGASPVDE